MFLRKKNIEYSCCCGDNSFLRNNLKLLWFLDGCTHFRLTWKTAGKRFKGNYLWLLNSEEVYLRGRQEGNEWNGRETSKPCSLQQCRSTSYMEWSEMSRENCLSSSEQERSTTSVKVYPSIKIEEMNVLCIVRYGRTIKFLFPLLALIFCQSLKFKSIMKIKHCSCPQGQKNQTK